MPSNETTKAATQDPESALGTIAAGVLNPIPGEHPAGIDIRDGKLWVELMKLRPRPSDPSDMNGVTDMESVSAEWAEFRRALEETLCTTTKDLELALFLTEANARVHGFEGLRDALEMLGGLVKGFLARGLHPCWDDGDLGAQLARLHWLNEKLPDIVSEIALTRTPEPGPNYSLNYFNESQRQGGMITAEQFDQAAAGGSIEEYKCLAASIGEARSELTKFKAIADEAYGAEAPSFSDAEVLLVQCGVLVEGIVRKLTGIAGNTSSGTEPAATAEPAAYVPAPSEHPVNTSADAWTACEAMVRNGNVDKAIAAMAALASREPNGRVRFQRRLMLADLCMQTNRKKLGTSILEELNEIIETHKLVQWETSEVVGGIWTRLVRSYRDKAAGTQDPAREADLYLKLSRLDPWQAVACGEPRREE